MDDSSKRPASERKVKFRVNLLGSENESKSWIFGIIILSFFLSASLSAASSGIIERTNAIIASLVVLVIIIISIMFDIIGTAVTAADEAPFHSMASRKLYGARQSIRLIRNADKVSNFCNDVVGDICSVISGAGSTYIIADLAMNLSVFEATSAGLIITGLVASLTVGGKAAGKSIAIRNSNYIIYKVSIVVKFFADKFYIRKRKKHEKKKKT